MNDSRNHWHLLKAVGLGLFVLILPAVVFAPTRGALEFADLTARCAGLVSLAILVVNGYLFT